MSELKIMFWNIHNAYSYKVHMLTADDEAAEEGDRAQGANGGEAKAGEESKKDEPQRIERLFRLRKREINKTVSGVIKKIDPDIVVLVEYSLGKYALMAEDDQGDAVQPAEGEEVADGEEKPKSDNDQQVTFFDRFGPYQYRDDLNRLYKADGLQRAWDAQILAVNASDLFDEEKPPSPPFELYGILWDKSKVKAEERLSTETLGKTGRLFFKPRSPAATIFSLKDQPKQKFTLFMFHGPAKKKEEADGGTAKPEKDERVTSVKDLSELKRIEETVHGSKKSPLVIAGNFNLDRDDQDEKHAYEPLLEDLELKVRIDGKTEFAKKVQEDKAETAADEGDTNPKEGKEDNVDKLELTSACDNIFTLNFEEDGSQEKPGSIYDFIREDCENDVDQALSVSNHLPIYVTVRLK